MFDSVLIANRGEIACRVIRTCRRLGIRAVAVFSDVDEDALHVALADEAHRVGDAPARDSYLNIASILAAVRRSGAQAVHPGYGFLAESADFAQACADDGVVFVGPAPGVIRAMGAKGKAKETMAAAGVPVIPGYQEESRDPMAWQRAARKIGYPILVKPVAGGGGIGLRVVTEEADLIEAVTASRREAASAFGDDGVLIERFIADPRHIEVQVFADTHGHVVHLNERDCSVQRRHQKVVEETPAPGLDEKLRRALGEAAVTGARAIGYVGAGTMEFLAAAAGTFCFMEMNTRLQVEHPVTEMVTGLDLVEWQLRVAAGEPLPLTQDGIQARGHAIEVRIYAEDPEHDFRPSPGRLERLVLPREDQNLRVDAGIREGDAVPVHYDPMIAKLTARDSDRESALRRLRAALSRTQVTGVASNIAVLTAIVDDPGFAAGGVDTGYLERMMAAGTAAPEPVPGEVLAITAAAILAEREQAARARSGDSPDPYSPWRRTDGWRLNRENRQTLRIEVGSTVEEIAAVFDTAELWIEARDHRLKLRGIRHEGNEISATIDGVRSRASVTLRDSDIEVVWKGRPIRLRLHDPLETAVTVEATPRDLLAPIPGVVARVEISVNDRVSQGSSLVVLEAMKMEHSIVAQADGIVEAVHVRVGDQVEEGSELVTIKPPGETWR